MTYDEHDDDPRNRLSDDERRKKVRVVPKKVAVVLRNLNIKNIGMARSIKNKTKICQ